MTDATLAGVLGYLAFRFGDWATPCGRDQGNCFPLAPVILLSILVAVTAYFGLGLLLWRSSPGQWVFHVQSAPTSDDDSA